MSTTLIENYNKIVTIWKENFKKNVRIKFFHKIIYSNFFTFEEFIPFNYFSTTHNSIELIVTLDNKNIIYFMSLNLNFFILQVDHVRPSNLLFCYY